MQIVATNGPRRLIRVNGNYVVQVQACGHHTLQNGVWFDLYALDREYAVGELMRLRGKLVEIAESQPHA